MLRRITKPSEAVGKYRNVRVTHRKSLIRPTIVSGHDFVKREPLFTATDEEIAPELGDSES